MKNKNFIIIVIGQIISLFGNAIQRFSMSLYLLAFTGSTAAFANILAISTIPYILFAPIAGKLSGTVSRKKIMVYLDFFCAALIGVYALVLFKGRDHEIIVGAVMFILSICYTLYGPAVTSSIPEIVEEDKLTSANGIINQVSSVVNFAGPILAGLLYGFLGIKVIVVINAVSFFISAVMEMFLDIPEVNRERDEERIVSLSFIKKSFLEMKDSFLFLKKERKTVLYIIGSYGFCNIFLVPILSIVAPYFINLVLGLPSQIYGIVEGVCVLGMISGGMYISLKPESFTMRNLHKTYYPMIAGVFLMSVLGFISINNYAMAGIFAFAGMGIMLSIALSNVVTLTFIQREIPGELLGSVLAFSTAVATISVAPGQMLFGQIIEMGMPLGILLLVTALINLGLMIFVKNKIDVKDI